MASEIERKFLVRRESWVAPTEGGLLFRQGYLSVDPARTVRVRIAGRNAFLTIKGLTRGIERLEFEYGISVNDAEQMLDLLCLHPLIEKVRYRVQFGSLSWEVDEFRGENEGLILAEVELPRSDLRITLPPWIGLEVSDDPRYFNSNLSRNPFRKWSDDVSR
jgi:adenylate cyclase